MATIAAHEFTVSCLVALDADLLASGSEDQTIRIWDLKSGSCAVAGAELLTGRRAGGCINRR